MARIPKIWAIVYREPGAELEFLALKPNPEPGRNTEYYVITGGIERGEKTEQAVMREIDPIYSALNHNELLYSRDYLAKYDGHSEVFEILKDEKKYMPEGKLRSKRY